MKLMGILNLTPDSFFEPSRYNMEMLTSGADIVDIGAVSTRPGAAPVSVEEEWRRLEPVLTQVAEFRGDCPEISVDTTSSLIVRKTYDLIGDFIVNDISSGEDDSRMLTTVAGLGLSYVAMHKRGTPSTMDTLCNYPGGVVKEVMEYFKSFSEKAGEAGLGRWILDPGFGFAKTAEQNVEMLENLAAFRELGRPVLVGIADKRFTRGHEEEYDRMAYANGADILRVHDIAKVRKTLNI